MKPEKIETIKNRLTRINMWVDVIKSHALLNSKYGVDMTPFNHIDKLTNDIDKILAIEKMSNKEEPKDKCSDCPFNGTSCPGGMWCTEYD